MHTKSIEDIGRIKEKFGEEYSQRVVRQEIGVGMVQNPKYNRGRPYFVHFRPLYHDPHKIPDDEMETYKKFSARLDKIEGRISRLRERGIDTFDVELELRLARDKLKEGRFRAAEIYTESLEESMKKFVDIEEAELERIKELQEKASGWEERIRELESTGVDVFDVSVMLRKLKELLKDKKLREASELAPEIERVMERYGEGRLWRERV
jgi:hypothetical protein